MLMWEVPVEGPAGVWDVEGRCGGMEALHLFLADSDSWVSTSSRCGTCSHDP